MRRFLFFLAPVSLAAFAFACEDDPQNDPGVQFPEAGTIDTFRPPSDGGLPEQDAQPDGSGPAKGVTVVATGRTGPAADITVLFHDATGKITETKKTGADGKATSIVDPLPAMATIIFGEGTLKRRLLTWTGVAAGDELPAIVPADVALGSVEVTVANGPDAGVAAQYESFVGDCSHYAGFTTEPWSNAVSKNCSRGGGALLVRAADDTDTTLAFAFKKPITLLTDGGTVSATPGAWVAPVNVSLNVTNTTDSSGMGIFSQIAGTTVFSTRKNLQDTYSATFQGAGPTFADGYNVTASFYGMTPSAQRIIGKRVATGTTSVTFDANNLPAALTDSSIDETDKRRPIAKWTGSSAGMKGGIVRLFYFDFSNDSTTAWTLVVPAGGNEVKAPALPASLEPALPTPDGGQTSWDPSPSVAFADSNLLVDYGTFRKIQGLVFPTVDEDAQFEGAVLPQAGDFKITSWSVSNVE